MNNPYQLSFKLKQHTPIIHFQHNQEGATLRASEVKPKLDRFLMIKLCEEMSESSNMSLAEKYEMGKKIAIKKDLLIGNGNHPALNYKLSILNLSEVKIELINKVKSANGVIKKKGRESDRRIIAELESYPLFFGNLDKDIDDPNEYKKFAFCEDLEMKLCSLNSDLMDLLKKPGLIAEFLFTNNFGTRQSKGFGSYTVLDAQIPENLCKYSYNISHNKLPEKLSELKSFFEQIKIFYNCLRAGLHLKRPKKNERGEKIFVNNKPEMTDVFYFKSLIFFYAKQKLKVQWEKKTIKEMFFKDNYSIKDKNGIEKHITGRLCEQIEKRKNIDGPLHYSQIKKLLIKDTLGLSSLENWQSYNETISKIQSDGKDPLSKDKIEIQRFQTPFILKPIYNYKEKSFKVLIVIKDNSPIILDKYFQIERKSGRPKSLNLKTPDCQQFKISDFLSFIFFEKEPNSINYLVHLPKYVEDKFQNTTEYKFIENIFEQIRTKL
ncbi:MAG: hypothetical protein SGJ00_08855 [bacterium]|nr:hypothetical protein [bacterium]